VGGDEVTTLYLCGAGNSEGVRLALTINQKQARWDHIVILDDDPAKHGQAILGVEIAGPFRMLEQASAASAEAANLVARTTAKRWAARCKIEDYSLPFATLINPGVDITGAKLGQEIIAYQNATVGPQVSLGDASVVFMGGVVGHGSQLGRCCIVAPNAVINARARLGDGVYVGSNATVLPEVKVGPWATIGAGTVVTRDVPAGATVMGVPGKIILTLDLKLKMGAFRCLPQALRRELEGQVREAGSRPGAQAEQPGLVDCHDNSPRGRCEWSATNR
jgi:sugar O-acyltransferase (sialic acid O-acetyltransferase NeuD family)